MRLASHSNQSFKPVAIARVFFCASVGLSPVLLIQDQYFDEPCNAELLILITYSLLLIWCIYLLERLSSVKFSLND